MSAQGEHECSLSSRRSPRGRLRAGRAKARQWPNARVGGKLEARHVSNAPTRGIWNDYDKSWARPAPTAWPEKP
eukprot:1623135-Alexandrium_andersonii.AAC.1